MPQLDLFCVGGGESRSKVACETISVAPSDAESQCDVDVAIAQVQVDDVDVRLESFRIIWAWSGLAGAALERGGSTKGSSNPKTAAAETTRKGGASRAPRRLDAIVVGVLPAGKMVVPQRRSPVNGRRWHRPAAGARVFASEALGTEPVSPKVSCFGAVRSDSRAPVAAPAPAPRWEEEQGEERTECWASVTSVLRDFLCGSDSDDNSREGEFGAGESEATAVSKPPAVPVLSPPPLILGLGDVKRIASRRWPDGVAGDGRSLV